MRSSMMILAIGLLFLGGCASGRVVARNDAPSPAPSSSSHVEAAPNVKLAMQGPVAVLGVPPGQYPPVGECRVWMPGTPPGQQPAPCSCFSLLRDVPVGAWVLYRPSSDPSVVQVTTYEEDRPNMVASVDFYDAKSGEYVRSVKR